MCPTRQGKDRHVPRASSAPSPREKNSTAPAPGFPLRSAPDAAADHRQTEASSDGGGRGEAAPRAHLPRLPLAGALHGCAGAAVPARSVALEPFDGMPLLFAC